MNVNYWVVIPAAGVGQRFGGNIPKQYHSLHNKPIIEHTLSKFLYHPRIKRIVVAIDAQDYFWPQLRLDAHNDKVLTTTGGAHRAQSVLAGLQKIQQFANPNDFVLVHDAVRPCVTHDDIDKLIDSVGDHPIGGILGARVRDTLKHTNVDNEIMTTIARDNVWQALTPQMFRVKLLSQALQSCILNNQFPTDEAGVIEASGFVPMIVEGRRDNIKITYAEDLLLAERYLIG